MKTDLEITMCDSCRTYLYSSWKCLGCGKDLCYLCAKAYPCYADSDSIAVSVGHYCKDCDVKCINDPLHKALVSLRTLLEERSNYITKFYERRSAMHDEIERLKKLQIAKLNEEYDSDKE